MRSVGQRHQPAAGRQSGQPAAVDREPADEAALLQQNALEQPEQEAAETQRRQPGGAARL